jgi:hypothetical protein
MLEITVHSNNRPSSKRAIAFARHLMESKKEMIEETKKRSKTPEFQEMLKKLRELNGK